MRRFQSTGLGSMPHVRCECERAMLVQPNPEAYASGSLPSGSIPSMILSGR